mmetsp:Transcript_3482/g.8215  ORF Transcript_3482/g.8215 Transcript_3482/m.8215 type:complete len:291 (-) Transcript_3482:4512-5384(-)
MTEPHRDSPNAVIAEPTRTAARTDSALPNAMQSIVEAWTPHLVRPRMDRDEPQLANCSTLQVREICVKLRRLSEDVRSTKLITEIDFTEPARLSPRTDAEDPILTALRIETELPRCRKSSSEVALPSRATVPRRDSELPSCASFKSDTRDPARISCPPQLKLDPSRVNWRTDTQEPTVLKLRTDIAEDILAHARSEKLLPKCVWERMLQSEDDLMLPRTEIPLPSRIIFRSEMLLPNALWSSVEIACDTLSMERTEKVLPSPAKCMMLVRWQEPPHFVNPNTEKLLPSRM